MALPPSQRPRRIPPPSNTLQPLATGRVAGKSGGKGASVARPVIPLVESRKWLPLILSVAFAMLLFLPPIAAGLISSIVDNGGQLANPSMLGTRIAAFFCEIFGLWGLAWFTWACCCYSQLKGHHWTMGLLALLGAIGPLIMIFTDAPIAGMFSVAALTGLIVPYTLEVDELQLLVRQRQMSDLGMYSWLSAFALLIGISFAYGNSFRGGMTLDNKYIIEEYYKQLLRQDPTLNVVSGQMMGYIFGRDYWWPKGISGLYRPLVTFSYWVNYVVGDNKLDPFPYHVVNFLLHYFAAVLGFLLIRQLTRNVLIAFCAALLFVTHPIATESVSNIIGRADIMAAMATFAGIVLYIDSTTAGAVRRWIDLSLLLLVTFLGIFAKESAVAIAGVMVAYDVVYRWTKQDFIEALPTLLGICIVGALSAAVAMMVGSFGFLGLSEGILPALGALLILCTVAAGAIVAYWLLKLRPASMLHPQWDKPWKKFFVPYLFIAPPMIAWIAARGKVFHDSAPPETPFLDNPIRGLHFFAARMTASDVFLRLIGLLAWPVKLSCDYSFNQIPLFKASLGRSETWLAIAGALCLIAMLWLAVIFWRRQKAVSFLILFYLVVYLPTSNFLIIIGSIMAERFLYLPLLAFTACLVLLIDRLLRRYEMQTRRIATCAIVVVISLIYSIRTAERNQDWLSDVTLWASAIQVSPVSFRSYQSDAFALFEQYTNKEAADIYKSDPKLQAHDIDQIIAIAEKAKPIVDVLPSELNSSRLYLHLGMYYSKKGDTLAHPKNGLVSSDDPAIPWYRKGEDVLQQAVLIDRTFNGINREKELKRKIKKPSEISDVGLPPIYYNLGYDYSQLGDLQKALQSFYYLAHLDPADSMSYTQIAMLLMRQRRCDAAASATLEALILNPNVQYGWQQLAAEFPQVQPDGDKALLFQKDNRVQLNTSSVAARSALCLAYQNLTRDFLQAKQFEVAERFANTAKSMNFPGALFDEIFLNSGTDVPEPPPPDIPRASTQPAGLPPFDTPRAE